jgi:dihydroorotate dehydrogenase
LKYSGTASRPRAGKKRDRLHEVDFAVYRFCCIPLFNAGINKFLLIRSNVNEKNKSLILHQISTEIEKTYNDLANFIDTAGECAEFIFD